MRGEARLLFVVEMRGETAREKVVCDDPAVEAVLEGIPQSLDVYLWGKNTPPASVFFEIHEEDIKIEEDDNYE